jgi:AGCS family alanine or glycine:cation symporter
MNIILTINHFLWDYLLLFGLLGTGFLFSLRLGFIQIFCLPKTIVRMCTKKNSDTNSNIGISSLQALATAIAAQVGTGNLAGAATAIVSGGPGAIFWMWVSAFFGMGTIYAESVLAQRYRVKTKDVFMGGPAYYISEGLNMPWLAGFFAVCTIFALGFIGCMVQANAISHAFKQAFDIPHLLNGFMIAGLLLAVIQGGVKRIAAICEWVVPAMALFYLVGCIWVLMNRCDFLIPAIKSIFVAAFSPQAALGGAAGISIQQAMRYGVARGLFSNEAGMGSTPHAHAAANVKTPNEQGEVAIFSVFFDTFIVLTMTALVILTSNTYIHMIGLPSDHWITSIHLTQSAFNDTLPSHGEALIAITLLFFAFSTILGWYYFAEINFRYLLKGIDVKLFQWFIAICVMLGTLIKVDIIWELADTFNGLMCLPNLIALWLLQNQVLQLKDK